LHFLFVFQSLSSTDGEIPSQATDSQAQWVQIETMSREDLPADLRAHVQRLAGAIGERNAARYASLEEARLYIEQSLTHAGYEIQHDAFDISGRTYRNVIVERQGSEGNVLIIGAHYDTARGTPGADDNASGRSAVYPSD